MGDEFKLEDALIVLRRRILYFVLPVIVLAPIAVAAVMMLPASYTASGTMLVESQQISEDLIRSTVTSYAQERIQVIRQRVMTRERLLTVADDFDLFPDELGLSDSERVERMRDRLSLQLISVDPGNRRRDADSTIAFTVSYTDRSPQKAFEVANRFMTLFQTEDANTRTRGASETTEFFGQEATRLREALERLESRIGAFKNANAGALPEQLAINAQQLARASDDLTDTQAAILIAEEELRALELELASFLAGGDGEAGPAREIARLKTALAALRADKTDAHPDVRALRSQIRSIEDQLKPSREIAALRAELDTADAALRAARDAPEVDAEEVARLADAAKEARQSLSAQLSSEATGGGDDLVGRQLSSRIESASSRLNALNDQSDRLRLDIQELNARIAQTPEIERGLLALQRDYQNLSAQYQQVLAKQQQAIIAENLEEEQKAEKFSILDAAVKPEEPSAPPRDKLLVLAVLAALGVGAVTAVGAEVIVGAVRGREHVTALMGEPPLASIPYIRVGDERRWTFPRPTRPNPPAAVAAAPAE
ncbi:MAG: GNVR domain-containing protein [Parvularculaceae bacterium]